MRGLRRLLLSLLVALPAVAPLVVGTSAASAAVGGARHAARIDWRPASYAVAGTIPVRVAQVSTSPGVTAYLAWIDPRLTQLALYPGTGDPASAFPRGSGDVPSGQRWRLLATFNGGFKSGAGAGGFLVNGHVDMPLQRGLGTLVEYRNGRADIVDWQGQVAPSALVLARQNLPLLVSGGRPTARSSQDYLWGATLGNVAATWRTAIGIDARGDLIYAAAPDQTAASLAALMVRVGAVRAIELDINPYWPGFNVYGRRGGREPLKLVPNPNQSAYRWLVPDSRDFFAVYTRAGGGGFVPFR
jgi:hypothetical protein